ncbi:MAG: VWA domain-containing protein [Acidobacteriota bacterium]|nr:VWA domain-containing protein [Acidobacteriota bacterium]
MNKITTLFCLAIICLTADSVLAQSRRGSTQTDSATKANKREPQPIASPTPAPEPSPEEIAAPNDGQPVVEDSDAIKIETELVAIPFKVTDRKGRFVVGLTKENFQVTEDNAEQEIAYFTNEEQPFTVALILDMSYSSKFKIAEIQSAALGFINQLRPNDKVMVVAFDEEIYVLCNPTNDREVLQRAIKGTKIGYGTSLYEAVNLVMNEKLAKIAGRKAIVLFTDGVDTTSRRASDFSNLSDALELDALIYPIEYDTYADVQALKNKPVVVPPTSPIPSQNKSPFPFPIPNSGIGGIGTPSGQGTSAEDYRRADEYLNQLADRTNARLYKADTTANLTLAFSNIAAELRQFYSLGYYPKDEAKIGKKRKIKVRVNQKDLVVRARDGYIVGKKGKK